MLTISCCEFFKLCTLLSATLHWNQGVVLNSLYQSSQWNWSQEEATNTKQHQSDHSRAQPTAPTSCTFNWIIKIQYCTQWYLWYLSHFMNVWKNVTSPRWTPRHHCCVVTPARVLGKLCHVGQRSLRGSRGGGGGERRERKHHVLY